MYNLKVLHKIILNSSTRVSEDICEDNAAEYNLNDPWLEQKINKNNIVDYLCMVEGANYSESTRVEIICFSFICKQNRDTIVDLLCKMPPRWFLKFGKLICACRYSHFGRYLLLADLQQKRAAMFMRMSILFVKLKTGLG